MTTDLIPAAIRAITERFPAVVPHLTRETRIAFAIKADLSNINATYHDAISQALASYFEGGSVTGPRNKMQRAMVEAFGEAFDTGWIEGGAEGVPDGDALGWLNTRVEQEMANIATLFQQAKELRESESFDVMPWVNARADGYTRTLSAIYGQAKLLASNDIVLEFGGTDGKENCGTCRKLKGKKRKVSYILENDLFPYPGNQNFECQCFNCDHYWFNPKTGERYDAKTLGG